MRYYSDGNLAEKISQQSIPYRLPEIYIPDSDDIKEQQRRNQERLEEFNEVRIRYKDISRSRARVSVRLLTVLLVLAAAVGYIVWRGARLTEMSFYNAGLKRQINELDKENSLLQDKISRKSSLYAVKDVATSELGLQKPGSDQIVYVPASILKPVTNADNVEIAQQNNSVRLPAESVKTIESWVRGR